MMFALAITATAKADRAFLENDSWKIDGFDLSMKDWDFSHTGGDNWVTTPIEDNLSRYGILAGVTLVLPETGSTLPVGQALFSMEFTVEQLLPGAVLPEIVLAYTSYTSSRITDVLVNSNSTTFEVYGNPGTGRYTLLLNPQDVIIDPTGTALNKITFVLGEASGVNEVVFGIDFDSNNSSFEGPAALTPEPASCVLLGALALGAFPFVRRLRNK